jgi:hypothetical protein
MPYEIATNMPVLVLLNAVRNGMFEIKGEIPSGGEQTVRFAQVGEVHRTRHLIRYEILLTLTTCRHASYFVNVGPCAAVD